MPKFSIIIGHYKQWETLPMLFESLAAQTFQDFDIHFCDDGSGSFKEVSYRIREMLEGDLSHLWPRIRIHVQEHRGMRLARNVNQGIRAARGEYCVFIMADSFIEVDYLQTLNEYADPGRIVCGIRIQLAKNAAGELEGVDMDWRVKKNLVPQFPSAIIAFPWLCLTGNGLTIPTGALREYGPWLEELEGYGGEDNEIVARLFFKGYICYSVPELRLYHHWHPGKENATGNARRVQDLIKQYGS